MTDYIQTVENNRRGVVMTLVVVAVLLVIWWNPQLMLFQAMNGVEFLQEFAPLLLAALFIERAVEVLISSRRSAEATELARDLKAKQKDLAAGGKATETDCDQAEKALNNYRSETAVSAFALAVALGLAMAVVGVRVLETFADAAVFETLASSQQRAFRAVDVVISGAVLGGGADGLHKIVQRFLNFVEKKP